MSKDTKRHQQQIRITDFAEVERDKRAAKIADPHPKPKPDYSSRL